QVEGELVRIWQEVLGHERIGINDNFFELGGHSLKATQVISRLYKDLDLKVELGLMFIHPTIKELGEYLIQEKKQLYKSIKLIEDQDHYVDNTEAFDLLAKATKNGISISISNNDKLEINFHANKKLDDEIVQKLKENNNKVVGYLKNSINEKNRNIQLDNSLIHNDIIYFKVNPVQHYWVNDEVDKYYKETNKRHGICNIKYKLNGPVDTNILKKTIRCLAKRHESLRATFHKIKGEYYMKVEDAESPYYDLDCRNINEFSNDKSEMIKFLNFDKYTFDFTKALFLSRLVNCSNDEYLISINIHHIIFDTWSEEILMRDFLKIYKAFTNNDILPKESELKYQLKDFLSHTNSYNKINHDTHKKYWNSLNKSLPPELFIPGAKPVRKKNGERAHASTNFIISNNLLEKLAFLSKKYSASFFVLLQAAFKAFLFKATGQNDIVIGTYVFGRDYRGSEEQIGGYAKTVLIRTILDNNDSYSRIVHKVKRSNQDMQNYKAYPLMDALKDILLPGRNLESFWKINIQYTDLNRPYLKKAIDEDDQLNDINLEFTRIQENVKPPVGVEMQLYFAYLDNRILLDVEYCSDTYTKELINKLFADYFQYIQDIPMDDGANNKNTLIDNFVKLKNSTTEYLEAFNNATLQVEIKSQFENHGEIRRTSVLYIASPKIPSLYCLSYINRDCLTRTEYQLLTQTNTPIGKIFNKNNSTGISKKSITITEICDENISKILNVKSTLLFKKEYEFWVDNLKIGNIIEFFNAESLSHRSFFD
ncbi:MAG: condensation domain-containing protein, partial [Cytophagales bacterium]|nr:condensation domain-containing protein [Cytophagales bacterium]